MVQRLRSRFGHPKAASPRLRSRFGRYGPMKKRFVAIPDIWGFEWGCFCPKRLRSAFARRKNVRNGYEAAGAGRRGVRSGYEAAGAGKCSVRNGYEAEEGRFPGWPRNNETRCGVRNGYEVGTGVVSVPAARLCVRWAWLPGIVFVRSGPGGQSAVALSRKRDAPLSAVSGFGTSKGRQCAFAEAVGKLAERSTADDQEGADDLCSAQRLTQDERR